jgi:8-oxo-dGTP pyrophosphatase MutT (NUDIX family)
MGEAGGARTGGAGAGSGRRRRRRPRRTSGRRGGSTTTPPDAKGAVASARGATGTSTRSKKKKKKKKTASTKRSAATRRAVTRRKAPPVPTKREISAGGVVYRRDGGEIDIVLASRRTRRGQLAWGLAKGGIEDGESMEDAAVREVREETGLVAEIEASLGETRYFYVWENVRIRKTVHFFLMRHTGGDIEDRDDEMEEIRWFPLERALKRAAYRGERDVLSRASELLG